MDFNELLQVLWRRKLIVVALTAIVIALAFVAIRLVTPIYESSSTLTLGPKKLDNNTYFYFATMDTIVPVYADAATSRSTKDAASANIGHSLAGVTV
jgi:capsular polysaccharide biosynthesis protein